VQFVAICDVRADRRQSVKATADAKYGNKDCAMYRDMFELLGRPDIDAVLIATGDRWHAPASILAAKAGKDIYSEKPCGITIGLCQALDDTIRRYGRVFQAGTQRRSVANFQAAIHLAQSGKLGKLRALHASIYSLRILYDWKPTSREKGVRTHLPDQKKSPDPFSVPNWEGWRGRLEVEAAGVGKSVTLPGGFRRNPPTLTTVRTSAVRPRFTPGRIAELGEVARATGGGGGWGW
jgi:hypothetical protein